MKLWTLALPLMFSVHVTHAGSELVGKFVASDVVQNNLKAIEREHHVTCDVGRAQAFIPKLFKKATYRANCGSIKLKISASFKSVSNPVFKLERVKVWDKDFLTLRESEEFARSSDPFLEAYKKSQLVRDVRHFVENTYEVVCREGRVRKGIIGGKANYFYFAKCVSDTLTVKIKMKSKVRVFDDRFKFDLTKYKLTFK